MPHRFEANPIEPDPLPSGAGGRRGRGGSRIPITTTGLLDPEPGMPGYAGPAKQSIMERIIAAIQRSFTKRPGK